MRRVYPQFTDSPGRSRYGAAMGIRVSVAAVARWAGTGLVLGLGGGWFARDLWSALVCAGMFFR